MADEAYDEAEAVFRRRYDEAVEAGLAADDALVFAESDADVGLLRKMVKGGATVDEMCRALL